MLTVLSAVFCVFLCLTNAQAPAPAPAPAPGTSGSGAVSAAPSQPCYPCDPLWPRPYYYPDLTDCSVAWQCLNGKLSRFTCPVVGQVVDFVAQDCVTDGPDRLFTCRKMTNTQCTAPTSG